MTLDICQDPLPRSHSVFKPKYMYINTLVAVEYSPPVRQCNETRWPPLAEPAPASVNIHQNMGQLTLATLNSF